MAMRPMLFDGEMVRALLAGRKTQTRRPIRHQPVVDDNGFWKMDGAGWGNTLRFIQPAPSVRGSLGLANNCPLGKPGDHIWVRERARVIDYRSNCDALVRYEADQSTRWVNMPSRLKYVPVGRCIPNGCHREASRILLEITGVRAERLNDISQADAIAEGMPPSHPSIDAVSRTLGYPDFSRSVFAQLWQFIYGEKAWSENKWVWVIEFKRIEGCAL